MANQDIRRVHRLVLPLRDYHNGKAAFCKAVCRFRHLQQLWVVIGDGIEDEYYAKAPHAALRVKSEVAVAWEDKYGKMGVANRKKSARPFPEVYLHVVNAVWAHEHMLDGSLW